MKTKLKAVLETERISQTLLYNTIAELVEGTNLPPVGMKNISLIVNGKQDSLWVTTLDRIIMGINHLRKREKPYDRDDILGEVE